MAEPSLSEVLDQSGRLMQRRSDALDRTITCPQLMKVSSHRPVLWFCATKPSLAEIEFHRCRVLKVLV